jgi:UDP-N-acetylglucosamine 2-epimerase
LCEKVKVIPPLGYLEMLNLMAHSRKILTDSGWSAERSVHAWGALYNDEGEYTEWVETVEDRGNVLVGADYQKDCRFNQEFRRVYKQKKRFWNRKFK